ncbi:MAG: hypothetical protein N4J56_004320 [Chroococcidiopsis sp. SAG 2025]|nr:hypothetical protein [Chroococcidiopsis sp. SAG 2025]MDV2994666.1 hypothetical protein [Chroococcidiopsis sp. SAG 2025]
MNSNIPFETVLQLLAMAYLASVMLVLLASSLCLAVVETVETIEEAGS